MLDGLEQEKFSFQMTPEEKEERKRFYGEQFRKVTELAVSEDYDVLFMDEVIYAISAGLLEEEPVLDFLKTKPKKLEVLLTGNYPGEEILKLADYVSEIKKVKHPFDRGVRARRGIEK